MSSALLLRRSQNSNRRISYENNYSLRITTADRQGERRVNRRAPQARVQDRACVGGALGSLVRIRTAFVLAHRKLDRRAPLYVMCRNRMLASLAIPPCSGLVGPGNCGRWRDRSMGTAMPAGYAQLSRHMPVIDGAGRRAAGGSRFRTRSACFTIFFFVALFVLATWAAPHFELTSQRDAEINIIIGTARSRRSAPNESAVMTASRISRLATNSARKSASQQYGVLNLTGPNCLRHCTRCNDSHRLDHAGQIFFNTSAATKAFQRLARNCQPLTKDEEPKSRVPRIFPRENRHPSKWFLSPQKVDSACAP